MTRDDEEKRIKPRETKRDGTRGKEREERPRKQEGKELRGIGSFLLINALHEC